MPVIKRRLFLLIRRRFFLLLIISAPNFEQISSPYLKICSHLGEDICSELGAENGKLGEEIREEIIEDTTRRSK